MKRLLAAAVLAASVATAANAAVTTWTITDGTFSDTGTFSGSFTYDDSSNTVTSWDLVTSDTTGPTGGFPGFEYTSSDASQSSSINSGSVSFSADFGPFFIGDLFGNLEFDNIPLSAPATVSALSGTEVGLVCAGTFGCGPFGGRTITAGVATPSIAGAAPEPAGWALMIAGFGLAGAMLRRRKAAAAA
ncbi:PEPxxWA-CTERM sorting domain-containing protein [Phenylobacterium sp.]|jgi:hypothetical protein|uniref:PEPxxWA-CTERM sorting domain-containing protein n=1 Tax=Phenylobacterium sp. TaxID=1871053 RepID=UPI002F40254F